MTSYDGIWWDIRVKIPDVGPRGQESERVARKAAALARATTVMEIVYLYGTREDLKISLSTWISSESYVQIAVSIKLRES
jgi:hypothetical protein